MDRHAAITSDSIGQLCDRLIARGVPVEIVGDVSADLGDVTEGLETIQSLFAQFAEGHDAMFALDEIESECRDHLIGHLQSIRKTTKKLRRLSNTLRPPAAGAEP